MFVEVRVLRGESEPSTLVPASAIWEEPGSGSSQVFVVEEVDGLAEPDAQSPDIPVRERRVGVRRVHVLAEGQGRTGVDGIVDGEWVVTLGQHLIYEQLQTDGREETVARVRPTSWRQVLELQGLQREDLLEGFLEKQRRVAAVLGAELPPDSNAVDALLAGQAPSAEDPPPSPTRGN